MLLLCQSYLRIRRISKLRPIGWHDVFLTYQTSLLTFDYSYLCVRLSEYRGSLCVGRRTSSTTLILLHLHGLPLLPPRCSASACFSPLLGPLLPLQFAILNPFAGGHPILQTCGAPPPNEWLLSRSALPTVNAAQVPIAALQLACRVPSTGLTKVTRTAAAFLQLALYPRMSLDTTHTTTVLASHGVLMLMMARRIRIAAGAGTRYRAGASAMHLRKRLALADILAGHGALWRLVALGTTVQA